MPDQAVAITTGAAAAAGPALLSGRPPAEVLAWAVAGGLAAVLLKRQQAVTVTAAWIATALTQIALCTLAGVAGSAIVLSVAPAYPWLAPAAAVPQWALAFVIAAGALLVGPALLEALLARFRGPQSTEVGNGR